MSPILFPEAPYIIYSFFKYFKKYFLQFALKGIISLTLSSQLEKYSGIRYILSLSSARVLNLFARFSCTLWDYLSIYSLILKHVSRFSGTTTWNQKGNDAVPPLYQR